MSESESKGLSNEKLTHTYMANVSVCLKLIWMSNSKVRLTFKGNCLKQEDKAAYTPKNVVNLFTVNELETWSRDLSTGFTLKDYLF